MPRNNQSGCSWLASKVPLFISYLILSTSWVGFTFAVSLSQTLLAHGEILHFAAQQVIFNFLWIMTCLSLLVVSTRDPGRPDPELAPQAPPATFDTIDVPCGTDGRRLGHTEGGPHASATRDRPKSLKFLKNTYWMNSRITKDHASPLPLNHTPRKRQSPWFPRHDDESDEDLSTRYSASEGHDNEEKQGLLPPARLGVKPNDSSSTSHHTAKAPAWCPTCNAWKPERSHHCRSCGRCCLKMDHHCIWLGTCIGFHNYKPFLLFVTYATLLACFAGLEAGHEMWRGLESPVDASPNQTRAPECLLNGTCLLDQLDSMSLAETPDLVVLICFLLAFLGTACTFSIASLASFHWWLVLQNMTTLEKMHDSFTDHRHGRTRGGGGLPRHERSKLLAELHSINRYDLGWQENIRSVFGRRSKFLAGWPTIRAYRRTDKVAGHFFDVDPDKARRIAGIERQLEQGNRDRPQRTGGWENSGEDSDHDSYSETSCDSSSAEGDDELSEIATSF